MPPTNPPHRLRPPETTTGDQHRPILLPFSSPFSHFFPPLPEVILSLREQPLLRIFQSGEQPTAANFCTAATTTPPPHPTFFVIPSHQRRNGYHDAYHISNTP
ncbi:uncharacterized protein LOC110267893 [Arachis ipaensis]|uniref:uncharacterized protein LOC110267893 n=1 Tax=Arachis ipaensis TaxID=130454 RepID=UPI000A2B7C92|nr:uncharacterized protein LOC110267893 [Arachis ipaensis]